MSILVYSSAIPVDSCAILWTPANSSGIGSFLQESVGHGDVLRDGGWLKSTTCTPCLVSICDVFKFNEVDFEKP